MSKFVCSAIAKPESVAPASMPAAPLPKAGEIILTPGQKIALLKMRRSDWSKAVLAQLEAFGKADCAGGDYRALAQLGLAVCKGSFHVLTPAGRWRADRVAVELARDAELHIVTYDLFPRSRGAASAKCTCGWSSFRTRAIASYVVLLGADAHRHLEREGALP